MMQKEEQLVVKLNHKGIKALSGDSAKSAGLINLLYVNDKQEGIRRIKEEEKFHYIFNDQEVEDIEILARIRSLVIPPAWREVWISPSSNGHIQALGIDNYGRKQYRYHPSWNAMRSETKFFQLFDFGRSLVEMRKRIHEDLSLPGLPRKKVLAAVVSLMQNTGIRVGSNMYEKLYGSFGLSTMKDRHVKINGNEMRFSFKGKKGIYHDITLKSLKLAKIVKQCREIPGKELFQYYDEKGERKSVDSGMVNDYIKEISRGNFTSKDFRTWTGSLTAIKAFIELGYVESITATKRKINEAIDIAAKQLGNTRNVCRKYYIHPVVIEHYTNRNIEKYFKNVSKPVDNTGLTTEEQILMKMLAEIKQATLYPTG